MELKEIPMDKIKPNPFRTRKYFNGKIAKALANSVNNLGVLIQPIPVRPNNNGEYERMTGDHRYAAYKMLFKTRMPCFVDDFTDEQMELGSIAENTVRKNLNIIEKAEEINRIFKSSIGKDYMKKVRYYNIMEHRTIKKDFQKRYYEKMKEVRNKIKKILKIIDMSSTTAWQLLSIYVKISKTTKKKIIELLEKGKPIGHSHAYQISRLHRVEDQMLVVKEIGSKNLSIRETSELVNNILSKYKKDPRKVTLIKQRSIPNMIKSFFYYMDKTYTVISKLIENIENLDENTKKEINSKITHLQEHSKKLLNNS